MISRSPPEPYGSLTLPSQNSYAPGVTVYWEREGFMSRRFGGGSLPSNSHSLLDCSRDGPLCAIFRSQVLPALSVLCLLVFAGIGRADDDKTLPTAAKPTVAIVTKPAPPLTEREQWLLDKVELLEKRVAELRRMNQNPLHPQPLRSLLRPCPPLRLLRRPTRPRSCQPLQRLPCQ
jgi:hypothetical protein